jgi:hypothetical protein
MLKKLSGQGFLAIAFYTCIFSLPACQDKAPRLVEVKPLDNYPSGSGLGLHDKQVYVIGDDAPDLLVLDTQLNMISRIPIFESNQERIDKETKADLESIAMISDQQQTNILLTGSGSQSPSRDFCWIIDSAHKKTQFPLTRFFDRLKKQGLSDINIEGATSLPFGIMLATRGNKSFPKNFLVLTEKRFWEKPSDASFKLISLGGGGDSSAFSGVSGLDYSYQTDQLFITLSTEDTRNSYDDGAIGKSYLWIVNDISSKRKWTAINPDTVIDLDAVDDRFKGNKIESVCVIVPQAGKQVLLLVADDDKGGTVLFKLAL